MFEYVRKCCLEVAKYMVDYQKLPIGTCSFIVATPSTTKGRLEFAHHQQSESGSPSKQLFHYQRHLLLTIRLSSHLVSYRLGHPTRGFITVRSSSLIAAAVSSISVGACYTIEYRLGWDSQ